MDLTLDVMAKWYRRAGEQGHTLAQASLGDMYYDGFGEGGPDWQEALKWWGMAADKRETNAMCMVAYMYEEGSVVKQDLVEAYTWYLLAASYGHPIDPTQHAERLKLTPQQIAEAQARVKKWQEAHRK